MQVQKVGSWEIVPIALRKILQYLRWRETLALAGNTHTAYRTCVGGKHSHWRETLALHPGAGRKKSRQAAPRGTPTFLPRTAPLAVSDKRQPSSLAGIGHSGLPLPQLGTTKLESLRLAVQFSKGMHRKGRQKT